MNEQQLQEDEKMNNSSADCDDNKNANNASNVKDNDIHSSSSSSSSNNNNNQLEQEHENDKEQHQDQEHHSLPPPLKKTKVESTTTAIAASTLQPMIRIGLMGAGIFATSAHAPALRKLEQQEIIIINNNNNDNAKIRCKVVAIWSRRLESAKKLCQTVFSSSPQNNNDNSNINNINNNNVADEDTSSCQAYDDISEMLQRPDIDAIVMALPIQIQPQYIPLVLQSNKHLLSEKPIAPTVEIAKQLLQLYYETNNDNHHIDNISANNKSSLSTTTTSTTNTPENDEKNQHESKNLQFQSKTPLSESICWSIAENYRHEPGILAMAKIIQSNQIGHLQMVSFIIRTPFPKNNPYLQTEWRKQPDWYGGLFVDAFVHGSALLRTVLLGGSDQNSESKSNKRSDDNPYNGSDGNDDDYVGWKPHSVSACTSSHVDYIPSVDTMTAHVTWEKIIKRNKQQQMTNTTTLSTTSTTKMANQQQQEKEVTESDETKTAIMETQTQTNNVQNTNGRLLLSGVLAVTFACQTLRYELEIVGSHGTATLSRRVNEAQHGWKVVLVTAKAAEAANNNNNNSDNNKQSSSSSATTTTTAATTTTYTTTETNYPFGGIEGELVHFVKMVQEKQKQQMKQPQEEEAYNNNDNNDNNMKTTTNNNNNDSSDNNSSNNKSYNYNYNDCNSPREALEDLRFVEACLESGKQNGKRIYF